MNLFFYNIFLIFKLLFIANTNLNFIQNLSAFILDLNWLNVFIILTVFFFFKSKLYIYILLTLFFNTTWIFINFYILNQLDFNMLLLNSLNYIHPLFILSIWIFIFFLILLFNYLHYASKINFIYNINTNTQLFNNFFIYMYLISFFLGCWWSFQLDNWFGWWAWDRSEILILIISTPLLFFIHNRITLKFFLIRTFTISFFLIAPCFYYNYQLMFNDNLHKFFNNLNLNLHFFSFFTIYTFNILIILYIYYCISSFHFYKTNVLNFFYFLTLSFFLFSFDINSIYETQYLFSSFYFITFYFMFFYFIYNKIQIFNTPLNILNYVIHVGFILIFLLVIFTPLYNFNFFQNLNFFNKFEIINLYNLNKLFLIQLNFFNKKFNSFYYINIFNFKCFYLTEWKVLFLF